MSYLEKMLDLKVSGYIEQVENMEEVRALLDGEVSREDYTRFLKTFYVIEHISRRAVLKASELTQDTSPYLSKRFDMCAKGELGHAEIALSDLAQMGVTDVDITDIEHSAEYDNLLQGESSEFPLGILGHSYLFESASALIFPKFKLNGYPSEFAVVHAKEDPGHSLSIKRTVRHIEESLSDEDISRVISFAATSGEYLLRIFHGMKGG